MKAVLQRVAKASVAVAEGQISQITQGLLVLFCVEKDDTEDSAQYFAGKIAKMRIFNDENGKMNRSIQDLQGQVLVVSQFTLGADWQRGNRPSFSNSADPEKGRFLYQQFCSFLEAENLEVKRGIFGEEMQVELLNDGPVTIIMSS